MKILVTGATGFVGQKLVKKLFSEGHQIVVLSRNSEAARQKLRLPFDYHQWEYQHSLVPREALDGVEAVVHLMGESVSQRWSAKVKHRLYASRIHATERLHESFKKYGLKPKVFVSASAVGIYGNRAEERLTESSAAATGFLPKLCEEWEQRADEFRSFGTRVVQLRIGVVLGQDGGALDKMLLPFRAGGGGNIVDGRQWMSWIHVNDLVKMISFSLKQEKLEGAVNAVAPRPIRNDTFTRRLAKELGVYAPFPIPKFALKLIFGEMSQIMYHSQKVLPEKLLAAGFRFDFPVLKWALRDIVAPSGVVGAARYEVEQWLPKKRHEVFSFFSEVSNLEKITPPWLNFKILEKPKDGIKLGARIRYRLKIHGVPVFWRTSIDAWNPPENFIDDQRKGPYDKWEHLHEFEDVQDGTLIRDIVVYKVPFSIFGEILRKVWVSKDIEKIFRFRKDKIEELYGA